MPFSSKEYARKYMINRYHNNPDVRTKQISDSSEWNKGNPLRYKKLQKAFHKKHPNYNQTYWKKNGWKYNKKQNKPEVNHE